MTGDEKREPTLGEIMEEVKKSRDDSMKKIEGSRIAMWLTPAAFGGSIALFGVAGVKGWPPNPGDVGIFVVGLGFMFWARHMATRAQRQFKEKWNERAPKF